MSGRQRDFASLSAKEQSAIRESQCARKAAKLAAKPTTKASTPAATPTASVEEAAAPPSVKPPALRCEAGHLLAEFAADHDQCVCDRCEAAVPCGARLQSCRACDFDVCAECASSASREAILPAGRPAAREGQPRQPQKPDSWSPAQEAATAAAGGVLDITLHAYFGACRGGLFRDPNLKPTEKNLELLLRVLRAGDEQARRLNTCHYFQFSGSESEIWDPRLNARMAYEGFFTITTSRRRSIEPLPELQPFYSVVAWPNFEASRHVRKALGRLRRSGRQYCLVNNRNPVRTWELLDAYHGKKYGTNWLTRRYFEMLQAATADKTINFRLQCVELYEGSMAEKQALPLAGEIGFSIGSVYTSLSGWTEERTSEGFGTAQLVLLGRWLQQHSFVFWSMGHCYSPEMDYKRQLGHRVVPRYCFLALLQAHRGVFDMRGVSDDRGEVCALGDTETCEASLLL